MGTQAMEVMQEGDGHPLHTQGKLFEFFSVDRNSKISIVRKIKRGIFSRFFYLGSV